MKSCVVVLAVMFTTLANAADWQPRPLTEQELKRAFKSELKLVQIFAGLNEADCAPLRQTP